MKNWISSLLLAGVVFGLSGCLVIQTNSHRSPPAAPLNSADAATVAEIDAAAKLDFEPSRLATLTEIAKRPVLSPVVQLKLIETAYRKLSFADSKVALLRTIIANPSFTDDSRHAIVDRLQQLPFDANRQAVLQELNQRLTVPQNQSGS